MPRKLYPGQLLPRLARVSLPYPFANMLVAQSHPAHPSQSSLSAPYGRSRLVFYLARAAVCCGAARRAAVLWRWWCASECASGCGAAGLVLPCCLLPLRCCGAVVFQGVCLWLCCYGAAGVLGWVAGNLETDSSLCLSAWFSACSVSISACSSERRVASAVLSFSSIRLSRLLSILDSR